MQLGVLLGSCSTIRVDASGEKRKIKRVSRADFRFVRDYNFGPNYFGWFDWVDPSDVLISTTLGRV